MQITYEDYEKVVAHVEPTLDKLKEALDSLPSNTPIDEIIIGLCYMASMIIDQVKEEDEENFSIDGWYTIAVQSLLEKLKPQEEAETE